MDAREKLSTGPQAPLPDSTPARTENDAEDVRLMLLVRDGDLKAFETLVERHQQAVLGTVAKMLGHPTDAEDIAQQVFIRIWKSAARYEAQAKFTTWLFTIARNLVFNEMRRRQRKPTSSLEEREEITGLSTPDPEGAHLSPAESALHREMELAIDNAIQALPEKQRLAVILRRYEDMPYEQIGEVLNLSVPAVKSLLFRARTQLKELLKDYLD
ncbi:MAG: sigma-70 family RNA polymerase sigma factor [Verrucomicrobiae bacterium]|nr:sigma-70 family RNA polymerase sigma factor [Verrucomicrobiae bacterium]